MGRLTQEQRAERRERNARMGADFRARRLALRLSLYDLAERTGYRAATISQLETGALESVSDKLANAVEVALTVAETCRTQAVSN